MISPRQSGRGLRIAATLGYLALTPVAFYIALTTVFLGDSGQHLDAVVFLIITAFIWPAICVVAAVLPWFLHRRSPWLRRSVLALPILYPLFWFFALYPLAFALD